MLTIPRTFFSVFSNGEIYVRRKNKLTELLWPAVGIHKMELSRAPVHTSQKVETNTHCCDVYYNLNHSILYSYDIHNPVGWRNPLFVVIYHQCLPWTLVHKSNSEFRVRAVIFRSG